MLDNLRESLELCEQMKQILAILNVHDLEPIEATINELEYQIWHALQAREQLAMRELSAGQ